MCVCVSVCVAEDWQRYSACCVIYLSALYGAQIITSSNFSLNEQTSKELMDMAHQGIKLLTGWTTELVREGEGRG